MKNFLNTLLFSLLACSGLYAQNVVLDPSNVYNTGWESSFEIVCHSDVINLTTDSVFLTWCRTQNILPEGWSSLVCDKNNCWGPSTDTKDFSMAAGEVNTMDVHFNTGFSTGSGFVEITIKDALTGTILAVNNYEADGIEDFPENVEESAVNTSIKAYPNPVQRYLNVVFPDAAVRFELTDLYGRIVEGNSLSEGQAKFVQIPTAELNAGNYFIHYYDNNGKQMASRAFVKID